MRSEPKPGEIALASDPAASAGDARLVFIGRFVTPWPAGQCPKNMREARERGAAAAIEIAPPYRAGIAGLERATHIIVLSWLHEAARDLIVQHPRHLPGPRGVFALRSPVRPNPIGVHIVRLLDIDANNGRIAIDAADCSDGTPVLDIKPYLPSTDAFPEAAMP